MKAKQEFLEKALPPVFYRNPDEDHKILGTSPIETLFIYLDMNYNGTGDESTLVRERPYCLEGDDFNV